MNGRTGCGSTVALSQADVDVGIRDPRAPGVPSATPSSSTLANAGSGIRPVAALNILLLEDHPETSAAISEALTELGHQVQPTENGSDAYEAIRDRDFDAAIVDRLVPGIDGLSLVRRIRGEGRSTPVLMLSALCRTEDRVQGLEAGADDYLGKPFALSELIARLNAIVRRTLDVVETNHLRALDIEMDLLGRRVTRAGRPINLHPREFGILEQLLRHSDGVVTRTMLLEKVWDFDFDPRTSVVETQVSRLRSKLNEGFDRDAIQTVRGSGYMITSPSGTAGGNE